MEHITEIAGSHSALEPSASFLLRTFLCQNSAHTDLPPYPRCPDFFYYLWSLVFSCYHRQLPFSVQGTKMRKEFLFFPAINTGLSTRPRLVFPPAQRRSLPVRKNYGGIHHASRFNRIFSCVFQIFFFLLLTFHATREIIFIDGCASLRIYSGRRSFLPLFNFLML